ncbi:Mu transposase C-terminal domain-containing protein [Chitinibacter sp. S2-10]|uniref:Mu transposase C-terminal domain-containing protein n=1 Tax=Chitinibacter sp. S2-10 TaxID=3373597 RepID=UPI003977CF6A
MESRMILSNDLLQYIGDANRTIRVLWLSPDSDGAFIIDIHDPFAQPELIPRTQLLVDLQQGNAQLMETDPLAVLIREDKIPEKHIVARNHAWKIIQPLVKSVPNIYLDYQRGPLILQTCKEHRTTHKTVYKYLRRFWQRGQHINSLLPDYKKSGAKGQLRTSKTGAKLGRPRKYDDDVGINVSEGIRKVFNIAIQRHYVKNKKHSLSGAYDEMLKDFFLERHINTETGEVIHSYADPTEQTAVPSLVQFRYWYEKENNKFDIKRQRVGKKIYDKDMRGYISSSNTDVWGPGARFQIDATIADVYLVSRQNRDRIIGRPVLYIVIDVFSRMIVGLYVGLEGPSWVGAMMALANTADDKVSYCKRFGIDISAEDWPCNHLPATLLGDRGEIASHYIETLANNYNLIIENAAPYRADWKGIVEKRFQLLPAKFKAYVPGYIESDFRQRGAQDYRLDAVLDLDEFTQIIIADILYYNNYHELKNYDKDSDLVADEVLAVPTDLWEWGVKNRSGKLRVYPIDGVRFNLLPTATATVTEMGIRHNGSYYICGMALEKKWLDRARQYGRWKVTISYDPRERNTIYLHDTDAENGFLICNLTDRSRADRDLSEWEIAQRQHLEKSKSASHQKNQKTAKADLTTNFQKVVANATAKRQKSSESDLARTSGIRGHRAEEKEHNRASEAFRLGDDKTVQETSAKVIPFPSIDIYSEPDILEIRSKLELETKEPKNDL